MKNLLIFLTLVIFQFTFSQQAKTFKLKKYRIAYLCDSLKETSGLNFLHGKLYSFNDGGNPAEIFEIDKKSGKILSKIKTDFPNEDWEALTNDGENFYIGDFGNNFGIRKNLTVYQLEMGSVVSASSANNANKITFFYPEQKDFSSKPLNNDFDAEAMIFLNGKIHIFTKEWASKSVSHYILNSETSEIQPAEKVESFKTGFFVTDAYYFKQKLYVVGYTRKTEVFLEIFEETEPGKFFGKIPRKYYLGSALSISQIEGIAVNDDGIYISGEEFNFKFLHAKPSLYFIPWEKFAKASR